MAGSRLPPRDVCDEGCESVERFLDDPPLTRIEPISLNHLDDLRARVLHLWIVGPVRQESRVKQLDDARKVLRDERDDGLCIFDDFGAVEALSRDAFDHRT